MTCGKCPEGRRFNGNGIYCVYYGIIMNEKHECTLERGRWHDRNPDYSEEQREETGLQEDRGGAAAAVPGVLPGSGKREGVPGMEGKEEWRA